MMTRSATSTSFSSGGKPQLIMFVLLLLLMLLIPFLDLENVSFTIRGVVREKQNIGNIESSSSAPLSPSSSSSEEEEEMWWLSTDTPVDPDELAMDIIPNHDCGTWKCYFPSKKHEGVGYLFMRMRHGFSERINESYEFGVEMNSKYGLRHLMMTPPILIQNVTSQLFDKLLEEPVGGNPEHDTHKKKPFLMERATTDGILVQVVKSAPKPNIFFHLLDKNNKNKNFTGFDEDLFDNFFGNSSIPFNPNWKSNLLQDWGSTIAACTAVKSLRRDFQSIVDTDGHIWHFDLDRASHHISGSLFQSDEYLQTMILDPLLTHYEERIKLQERETVKGSD